MKYLVLLCSLILQALPAIAQNTEFVPNYDESKVPNYELPKLLVSFGGRDINDSKEWETIRRPEVLRMFEENIYGKMPPPPGEINYTVTKEIPDALDGLCTLKEIEISFNPARKPAISLLIFYPNHVNGMTPVFLGLNFRGNHSIHPDTNITITHSWLPDDENCNINDHTANEESRGCRYYRWPVERILDRGYALATVFMGDIDPDFDDGYENGVHQLFAPEYLNTQKGDNCASIGAWAWGLSRVMDYLEQDMWVDPTKVVLFGHSRLGKTALWAGACDQRFSIVISNNSGCGGAALSRRQFGETVGRINTQFPHWFCENFKKYNKNEQDLPVDQHMLLALMAPRPLYVASANEDQWADPKGEFLSLKSSEEVYQLYGLPGLQTEVQTTVNRPVYDHLGYHLRNGKHDITNYDWEIYLDFADMHFGK